MKEMIACIKKDSSEFIRLRKNVICSTVLLGIAAMILLVTNYFPELLSQLIKKTPDMITDKDSIIEMMEKLFPGDVKGSLGIFASDVGVFYTIVIALMCHGLLPGEIRDGKWIIPVNIGISKSKLIGSKCIVYACGIGLPVLVITNLYYYVSATLLNNNLTIETAVLNSVVLCFSVMGIVASTILLSVIYKHSILAALSVILTVMAAPDVLTFFTFGKYFPTYLLTFTYTVSDSIFDLIIPAIVLLLMTGVLFELSLKKLEKIEVVR